MNNSFSSIIESSKSIQIVLPTRPYFDQVAASLALFLSLKEIKEVEIYSPSPMTVEFNRLIGVNRISSELGNKNLTLKFLNYPADNIERVSYDIENKEFKLTVIPKSGNISPTKEQVDLSYSGIGSDTAILMGGANETHFSAITEKDLTGIKLVHIGIRELVSKNKIEMMSLAQPGSSLSEVIALILKNGNFKVTPDIATNLLLGIEEGSNKFTNEKTSAQTFEMVAYLMKKGGKRRIEQKMVSPNQFPVGAIPTRIKPEDKSLFERQPSLDEVEKKEGVEGEAPKDWIGPKIYKGTSAS